MSGANSTRRMPIGEDDFRELRLRELYYVDKSLFIKELIDDGAKVNLIARPRRFGKTLNLSMLRYYFERSEEEDRSELFRDLLIWQQGERYRKEQGRYPVIALTLKSVRMNTWSKNYELIRALLSAEFLRHRGLYDSGALSGQDRWVYGQMLDRQAGETDYALSLALLSRLLHAHYGEKVVILVDEYDTLLNQAWLHGFYDEAIDFLRLLLGEAFKNNIHLHKGVLTGIFRAAKESVFSGLNNLQVSTLVSDGYRERFGFTEEEVWQVLADFRLDGKADEAARWYNGYRFGEESPVTMYNPWSISQYANTGKLMAYWVNTSDNEIVRQLVIDGSAEVQRLVAELLEQRPIGPIRIDDMVVYRDIGRSPEAVWSFLLMAGYVKPVELERRTAGVKRGLYGMLALPNEEVYDFFLETLSRWLTAVVRGGSADELLRALTGGDLLTFDRLLRETVLHTLSCHDVGEDRAESFYHAFVLGMLVHLGDTHEVRSNRESGYGRYDVLIIPREPGAGRKGIILEFKRADRYADESLEQAAAAALRQIEERQYEAELHAHGIAAADIVKLGISFRGKEVLVRGGSAEG